MEPSTGLENSRTYHAKQAMDFSTLVTLKFRERRYGIDSSRVIRLRQPDGPSTDAGRKARQAIMLVRERSEAADAVVCGWIDVPKKKAELRGYLVVSEAHERRYRKPFDLSRGEYHRVLEGIQELLDGHGFETRISNLPRSLPKPERKPAEPSLDMLRLWPLIASGVLGFLVCYALTLWGVL